MRFRGAITANYGLATAVSSVIRLDVTNYGGEFPFGAAPQIDPILVGPEVSYLGNMGHESWAG